MEYINKVNELHSRRFQDLEEQRRPHKRIKKKKTLYEEDTERKKEDSGNHRVGFFGFL